MATYKYMVTYVNPKTGHRVNYRSYKTRQTAMRAVRGFKKGRGYNPKIKKL